MQRFDTVALTATRTSEGFIRDAPIVGRTGILHYINADGSDRYEYRPPEEAFDADSLASLMGKPITVGHKAMVTAKNAGAVGPIGTVLTAGRQDGDAIRADIVIYDLPTAARELSCGYTLDLDETPGTTPEGEHYDAVQRHIRYNHVAVVPKGRAGIARLNMDGDEVFEEERKQTMEKVRIDTGLEYDAAPEVKKYVEKLEGQVRDARADMDKMQAKYDAAAADLKKEQEGRAADKKAREDGFAAAVRARVALLTEAAKHKIEKADEMADGEIKKAVILAVRGDMDLEGKSADYIDAAYDMARADDAKHADGLTKQRQQIMKKKDDRKDGSDPDDLDAVMQKIREDEAKAWEARV